MAPGRQAWRRPNGTRYRVRAECPLLLRVAFCYNSGMKTRMLTLAAGVFALAAGGCGPGTGYIVKPVAVGDRLAETVIAADPGWFVSDKIALVDVEGVLLNQRDWSVLSANENPVALFVEKLDMAQADPEVRAIVLRINSPGGGVTAGDIMLRRVQDFRAARRVPIIAIIEDVGASGAYYVACGADTIWAHPTSVTGSIGVVVQTVSFAGTMKLLGIEAKAVTSGPLKEMGSPLKPLEEKDTAIFQGMVNEFYQRFVDVVAESRAKGRIKLSREEVLKLADGRVYTGEQAKANGLVDDLGYVKDAIALAKARSGAQRVKVVMYHRPWGYRSNFYSEAPAGPAATGTQVNLLNVNAPNFWSLLQPQFLYLWTGRMN